MEINIDFRLEIARNTLSKTQKLVEECNLAPLRTPNLIENFGTIAANLALIDSKIDDGGVARNKVDEYEKLLNSYHNLERDFTNKCNCTVSKL